MHILALVILAFVVGWIFNYANPKIQPYLPAALNNMWGQAAWTGAFILVTLFVAQLVTSVLPAKVRT